jgi:hypothetical protein
MERDSRAAVRRLVVPTSLMLAGQLLYVGVTQLHAGGDANDHHAIFATYARDGIWMDVHFGQFLGIAILIAGVVGFLSAVEPEDASEQWLGRVGLATASAALALYAALQAVDGVALKQAVNAWMIAPEGEKAARFAAAETVRWLEWGMRSYVDYTLGVTLLLLGASATRAVWMPRGVPALMALSGFAYLGQGWVAGTQGFSAIQSLAIVAGWVLCLVWMIWLAALAWRAGELIPG